MEVGEVHKGRVLKGRLITEAIKMQSVQSVLKDAAGDVVTVHIYNVPSLPAVVTTTADLKKAQAMFPEGQQIAVMEPFYKLMMDGTFGVRVDNPAEVMFLGSNGQCLHNAAEKTRQASSGSVSSDSNGIAELKAAPTQPEAQGRPFASKPRRPNRSKKRSNKAKGKQH